jgi:hypothetical protein
MLRHRHDACFQLSIFESQFEKDWRTLKKYIDISHDKTATSSFPYMTTNSLKNGSHVIVREGDTPFYLWYSTFIAYIIIMGIHTISSVYGNTICATDMTHIFSGPYLRTNSSGTIFHDKTATSSFPYMTTNSLKNGSHVIVREGDTPFYLWSSTYYSSPLGVKHAQVRCIKDEADVMEAEGIEYSAVRIGSQLLFIPKYLSNIFQS